MTRSHIHIPLRDRAWQGPPERDPYDEPSRDEYIREYGLCPACQRAVDNLRECQSCGEPLIEEEGE